MNKLALSIYEHFILNRTNVEIIKIKKMLAGLYPGNDKEELTKKYYVRKIRNILMLTIAFIVIIISTIISEITTSSIDESGRLARNGFDQTGYEKYLIANIDEDQIEINISVPNQKYSKEELEEFYKDICNVLPDIILGDNDSLDQVTNKLNLINSVQGYPFSIRWESGNYERIDEKGNVSESDYDISQSVELKCVMTYEDYLYEKTFLVTVIPRQLTQLEQIQKEIVASIQAKQVETQNEKYLQLPMSIGDRKINWRESPSQTGAIVALLSCVALIGIWWGVDNDLTKKYKRRDQLLRLDYSEFVSKLQLLISSGITLRKALERMEADYKLSLENGAETKYVYEELEICLKRLRDGASEAEVYLLFGERCGQMQYKKLMSLLVQNLKKGTSGLLASLDYEAKIAFEERKHIARRLGDEAQTKLLFPMIIMLSVVMIIILIPAYFSFAM